MSAEFGPSWSEQVRADMHAKIDAWVDYCIDKERPNVFLVYCGGPPMKPQQLDTMAEGIKAVLRGDIPSFTIGGERR